MKDNWISHILTEKTSRFCLFWSEKIQKWGSKKGKARPAKCLIPLPLLHRRLRQSSKQWLECYRPGTSTQSAQLLHPSHTESPWWEWPNTSGGISSPQAGRTTNRREKCRTQRLWKKRWSWRNTKVSPLNDTSLLSHDLIRFEANWSPGSGLCCFQSSGRVQRVAGQAELEEKNVECGHPLYY